MEEWYRAETVDDAVEMYLSDRGWEDVCVDDRLNSIGGIVEGNAIERGLEEIEHVDVTYVEGRVFDMYGRYATAIPVGVGMCPDSGEYHTDAMMDRAVVAINRVEVADELNERLGIRHELCHIADWNRRLKTAEHDDPFLSLLEQVWAVENGPREREYLNAEWIVECDPLLDHSMGEIDDWS